MGIGDWGLGTGDWGLGTCTELVEVLGTGDWGLVLSLSKYWGLGMKVNSPLPPAPLPLKASTLE
ncbi:hypothetical protein [Nostoc sp. CMAA1605]|uniref:hypothetical protein n=1 Tax=Nostoc sp. CMAA1605 TaxID=2055159 RepID=UPI001F1D405C|nr:hypothetical protein [Nostoc sp. CMAA1605]